MRKQVLFLMFIIFSVQTLCACETTKPKYDHKQAFVDPMEIIMFPIAAPAAAVQLAMMVPSIPFAIAYEFAMQDEREAYRMHQQRPHDSVIYQAAFYKWPTQSRSSVKAGDRVWKQY